VCRQHFTTYFWGNAITSPRDVVPRVDMRGTSFHGPFTLSRCDAYGMYEDYFYNRILIDIKPVLFGRGEG
jgi:hypothetical protein